MQRMRCKLSRPSSAYAKQLSYTNFSSGSEATGSEQVAEEQQQENEEDHGHDDDVMRDAGSDLQPTAFVSNQEEEYLKK